ncbi:TPA: hypothetical protein QCU10_005830 [Bacillus anthracis]|nr:hypothetical protein [Bacillus cereus biovar anthracis]HDR6230950.1 hypothetical protein [Bacillus cereus biovar anthracis]HDR6240477.1 hypothetical protein [Bacillus cereus biovar anthracis]HDR6252421.1 hypothetical protein [Bacillus cereus biovar anthracis]HDR6254206.1 hypothetical protein [Bacillus cereus biovar anthracis]
MKLWHFTYYVDKNNPDSEIKTLKIQAETGKEACEEFDRVTKKFSGVEPFTTVFRCEGTLKYETK